MAERAAVDPATYTRAFTLLRDQFGFETARSLLAERADLRDQFAAAALTGIIVSAEVGTSTKT